MKKCFDLKNSSSIFQADRKLAAIVFLAIILELSFAVSISLPHVSAESSGNIISFYVTVKPDLGGPGYYAFSPQWLVVQQGDQINLTLRNVENETLHLKVDGQPEVVASPGVANGSEIIPVESTVPLFGALNPGIFSINIAEHPEMKGQIVVLPTDWASYNPKVQTRSLTQIILPDFAGEGYDKYFPGVIMVNQGDLVNLTIRNTDGAEHGFDLGAYGLDETISPGTEQPDGTVLPTDTAIPTFNASIPGVFTFFCTIPCGQGHTEMVGTLVVLPTADSKYEPQPINQTAFLTIKPDFAGVGYDKYLPSNIFVNQNDMVNIKIRNTDTATHGFAMPSCGINSQIVASATESSNGSLVPTDTNISEFRATKPGIHEFSCTNNCGVGHDQMIGYFIVLPVLSSASITGQPTQTSSSVWSPIIYALLGLALLIVIILVGIIVINDPKNSS